MSEGFELDIERKQPNAKAFKRVRTLALVGRITTCIVLAIWLFYMLIETSPV